MRSLIEVKSLTKLYGHKVVVDHLDFQIKTGEIYALLGLNGAGKTTTIKMMLGLIDPTFGHVKYMNRNAATSIKSVLPRVGCIVENPGFYDNLTIEENLKILVNIVGEHKPGYVDELLKLVKIHAYKHVTVGSLDMSKKQKLALVRALINNPEILILDEPLSGLDPKSMIEIRSLLQRLSREMNITIFLSSHVLSEVEKLADRIAILHQGKLINTIHKSQINKIQKESIYLLCDNYLLAIERLEGHFAFIKHDQALIIQHDQVEDILALLNDDVKIYEIYKRDYSLEDYFLSIIHGDLDYA